MNKIFLIISFLAVSLMGLAQTECCFGGTVTLDAGAGFSTYSWSNGGGTGQTATYSVAGTYIVTVTDGNGCTGTASEVVTICPQLVASCSSTDNTSCSTPDGTATVSASGGCDGSYTYAWDTTPAQTTATATGLDVGTYTVTVTDGSGCTSTCSATVTNNIAPITVNISGTCNQ